MLFKFLLDDVARKNPHAQQPATGDSNNDTEMQAYNDNPRTESATQEKKTSLLARTLSAPKLRPNPFSKHKKQDRLGAVEEDEAPNPTTATPSTESRGSTLEQHVKEKRLTF